MIVLLCGRSFSGKTTVACDLADQLPATVVSLDAITAERGLLGGQGVAVDEWERTNEIARDRTRTVVNQGLDVVVDDTNSPRFLRDRWRTVADQESVPLVLVYVDTPIEVILARHQANREGLARHDVVDAVFQAHLGAFEPPADDERPVTFLSGSSAVPQLIAALHSRAAERVRPRGDVTS
jgi:predicted kinase